MRLFSDWSTGPEEEENRRPHFVQEHQERVPQADVRRAGSAARTLLQSLPRGRSRR